MESEVKGLTQESEIEQVLSPPSMGARAYILRPDGTVTSIDESLSRQRLDKDPFEDYYLSYERIIRPPFSFSRLYEIYEDSDVQQSCVKVYQKNIDGFGYQLLFRGNDTGHDRESPEAKRQETKLKNFFDLVNEAESMQTVRQTNREDFEVVGNAPLEVLRRPRTGEIEMIYHMPVVDTRMCKLDDEPIKVKVQLLREGKLRSVFVKKRFRRFVQLRDPGSGNTPIRWFKSFGDPRFMDATSGEYKNSRRECSEVATELLWLKNNFGGKTYGLPRVVGGLTDIMGRALAQFVNYDLFDNQGIPPILILVENGSLTEESKKSIKEMVRGMRGAKNWNRLGFIEAIPEVLGLEENSNVKITIKNMMEYRSTDQMFDTYLKSTTETIRQMYRLPALYLGGVGAYSYATAFTAQSVAEQQVFIPERNSYDEVINNLLVGPELGCNLWTYRSKGPRTVSSDELRLAIRELSNAGGLTANHVIDIANEMFGLQMSHFDQEWAKLPIAMVRDMLKAKTFSMPELAQGSIIDDVIQNAA